MVMRNVPKFSELNLEQLKRTEKIVHKLDGKILDGWLQWVSGLGNNYNLDRTPIEETLHNWEKWHTRLKMKFTLSKMEDILHNWEISPDVR
jgi:hypothetical protein